jgi:hypothetical protein
LIPMRRLHQKPAATEIQERDRHVKGAHCSVDPAQNGNARIASSFRLWFHGSEILRGAGGRRIYLNWNRFGWNPDGRSVYCEDSASRWSASSALSSLARLSSDN